MGYECNNTYEINIPFLGDTYLELVEPVSGVTNEEVKFINYDDKEGLTCALDNGCACLVADWRGATKHQTPHGIDPEVADVTAVNDKVTIVTFTDGTQEKAICREGDTFSIETGVTICLMKRILRLMFEKFGEKSGTNLYNNMLRKALKKKDAFKIEKEKAKEKEKRKRATKQRVRELEKKQARDNWEFMVNMLAENMKRNCKAMFEDNNINEE